MSIKEIKKDINSKIDHLNESQLSAVNQFIEKINSIKEDEWDLKKYIEDILNEKNSLLIKLAQ